MSTTSKDRRQYDAAGRRARAAQRRDGILDQARILFLADGYAATTVTAIAAAAQVSPETIYKTYGGKPGIVRTIFERSLLGSAPSPAEERSDAAQLDAADALSLFARFGELSAEVAPLTTPMMHLIRDAAAGGDSAMAGLLHDVEQERYARMRHNAEMLRSRGFLGTEVTTEHAADVMWTYTADDIYRNLVTSRGWSLKDYASFISNALTAALL